MPEAVTKGKIARKYLAHFIDSAFNAETPSYVRLGKDLEEYNTEMNAEVESKKNIWGENSVTISGYEPSDEVEPYYLEADDPFSTKILEIVHGRKVMNDLITTVVDVHVWKGAEQTALEAYKEEVVIEVTTLGGDTTGVQTAFTVHRTGKIVKGTFDMSTKTFSPASA